MEYEGDEEHDGFFTPPESPLLPSSMVPMAPTSIPSLPEDVAPSSHEMASSSPATHGHGEGLPVVNPPPSNAPMVFRFKSQRERDGMVAPPMEPNAPMEPSEGPPPPLVQGPK